VENHIRKNVKCLSRTYNGIEYMNDKFRDFCEQHGIKRHFIVRKISRQNTMAERVNMSIAERARCLKLNAGLAKIFWAMLLDQQVTKGSTR
jgi:transposase InsO family protein